MIDRKPFAVAVPMLRDSEKLAWTVSINGTAVGNLSKRDATDRATVINVAHKARVKEAVREAVEPLRAELRRLMDVVSEEDYGLLSDVLAETEPEA